METTNADNPKIKAILEKLFVESVKEYPSASASSNHPTKDAIPKIHSVLRDNLVLIVRASDSVNQCPFCEAQSNEPRKKSRVLLLWLSIAKSLSSFRQSILGNHN